MTAAAWLRGRLEPTVSVGALLWIAAGTLFVGLRLAFVLNARVGGFELQHLAGAWRASIGQDDSRFVPTLFQALSALTFRFTESEAFARNLALLATATTPFGLYALRRQLGEAGALAALLLLAIDAPGIAIGASASAFGFDVALALWFLVALTRPAPPWVWGAICFAVATAGSFILPLVVAAAAITLATRRDLSRASLAAGAAGAVLGILLSSVRYWLGWDRLTVPPFVLFARGFDEAWSGPTTLELVGIYSAPLVALGAVTAAVPVVRAYRRRALSYSETLLLAWAGVAAAWFLTSLNSHNPVVLAALTTPLALLSGPRFVEAGAAVWRADWRTARFLVPASLAVLALAGALVLQWARSNHTGDTNEQVLVAGFLILALACLGYVASSRPARPALFVVPLALAIVPALAAASGMATSSRHELLPSPASPSQARDLRDIARDAVRAQGGRIVIHPRFEHDITWPFRDSGTIVVASRVPDDATFVMWPTDLPAPAGFKRLEGEWDLTATPKTPPFDAFAYIRWFTNRNGLAITSSAVAVYLRTQE